MDVVQPMIMEGHPRSGHWPRVRDAHLLKENCCQLCGSTTALNVHHIKPYHLYPDLELEDSNLITLCEGGPVNCHFLFGHLLNWASYNRHVTEDAKTWRDKIELRPKMPGVDFVRFMPEENTPAE